MRSAVSRKRAYQKTLLLMSCSALTVVMLCTASGCLLVIRTRVGMSATNMGCAVLKNRKTCASCVFVNRYVNVEPYESHLSCALTGKWVAPTNCCEHYGTELSELKWPVENEISIIKRAVLKGRWVLIRLVNYLNWRYKSLNKCKTTKNPKSVNHIGL